MVGFITTCTSQPDFLSMPVLFITISETIKGIRIERDSLLLGSIFLHFERATQLLRFGLNEGKK